MALQLRCRRQICQRLSDVDNCDDPLRGLLLQSLLDMSEYWVSQAKFYCKFCNVWIADNKPTRQLHDGGAKHRFNVDDFHKKKRNEKLFGARSEGEIKQQLAEIERAAKEAVAADKLETTGLFYQKPAALAPGLPPPPPSRPSGADSIEEARSSSYGRRGRDTPDEEEEKQDVIEEDESGMYVVDGQIYLEGPRHENLLTRGMNCEVFIEDTDQWYSAVVLGRRDVDVPHTSIVLRAFEISYVKIEGQDEGEEQEEENEDGEMSNELIADEGVDSVIPSNVEESIPDTPGDCSPSSEIETIPPPPVEGLPPPPPPPPPPQFKMPPPILKLPLKPVVNEIENENGDKNENKDISKIEDEVVAVKRVRRSRWDTVTLAVEGSAVSDQTVIPPPPPPPLPPMLGALMRSSAMEGITEESAHSVISEKEGQAVIEAAEESDLQPPLREAQEPEMQTIVISGVRSDHLRLLCNEAGELHGPSGDVVSTRASRAGIVIPEVVESTGFGTWQTVSIRTIDEEEEALLREEEVRKEVEDARQATGGGTQSRAHLPEEDVMSTFDPYGTSIYKGRRVNQDQGNDEVVTMAKKGEVVGFKKRKKSGMAANTVTDGRHNDTDVSLNASSSSSSSGRSSAHIETIHSVSISQNASIKTEKLEDTGKSNLDVVIKTEIKQEPSIESGTSGVKTSFSFNGSRKQRKS